MNVFHHREHREHRGVDVKSRAPSGVQGQAQRGTALFSEDNERSEAADGSRSSHAKPRRREARELRPWRLRLRSKLEPPASSRLSADRGPGRPDCTCPPHAAGATFLTTKGEDGYGHLRGVRHRPKRWSLDRSIRLVPHHEQQRQQGMEASCGGIRVPPCRGSDVLRLLIGMARRGAATTCRRSDVEGAGLGLPGCHGCMVGRTVVFHRKDIQVACQVHSTARSVMKIAAAI